MSKRLSTDAYDILLGHNRWAIRELLVRCRELTAEQFHQPFDIGPAPGTLHDNLTHMISAMAGWADTIDQRPKRPRVDGRTGWNDPRPATLRSVEELMRVLEEVARDFGEVVGRARSSGAINEMRDWPFGGKSYRFTVGAAVLHVTNHGMHHRAQCMNMLRRLGKPVGCDLDELEWQVAGEP